MEQKIETEQIKLLCPKCKAEVTDQGYEMLRRVTGYSLEVLKNGGMNKVVATWSIGVTVLQSTGAKVVNEESATKIVQMALEAFRNIQSPEIEKQKILEAEERGRREFLSTIEQNEELKEELKQQKKENKELEERYNATLERIEGHLGKFLNIPTFRGVAQEKMIAKTLAKFAKQDDFTREKATNEGEDIKAIVKEGKQELGIISIESKNNKTFKNDYISKLRIYMGNHQTTHGILACKTLPDPAQDDRLYEITEDGIWITSLDYLPFCYLAVRELLKKAKQLDIDSTKNKEEYLELVNRFRATIESKQYKDKIIAIREGMQLLRNCSDKLRSYSKNHCDTLNELANSIINNMASIETMNREAIGGDSNAP